MIGMKPWIDTSPIVISGLYNFHCALYMAGRNLLCVRSECLRIQWDSPDERFGSLQYLQRDWLHRKQIQFSVPNESNSRAGGMRFFWGFWSKHLCIHNNRVQISVFEKIASGNYAILSFVRCSAGRNHRDSYDENVSQPK